jgi:hypothetical protein
MGAPVSKKRTPWARYPPLKGERKAGVILGKNSFTVASMYKYIQRIRALHWDNMYQQEQYYPVDTISSFLKGREVEIASRIVVSRRCKFFWCCTIRLVGFSYWNTLMGLRVRKIFSRSPLECTCLESSYSLS